MAALAKPLGGRAVALIVVAFIGGNLTEERGGPEISGGFCLGGEIDILLCRRGKSAPFADWIASLKDARTAGIVRARLNRIRLGNFGDCRPVGGGVEEVRIDWGPGCRVYFGRQGLRVVILLCAGNKKAQAKDIRTAQIYWKEFLNAQTSGKD